MQIVLKAVHCEHFTKFNASPDLSPKPVPVKGRSYFLESSKTHVKSSGIQT